MFPSYDEEVLKTLLMANNNHIERAIESILQMEGEAGDAGTSGGVDRTTPDLPGATAAPPTGDLLFGTEDDSHKPGPEQEASSETAQIQKAASNPPEPRNRGAKITLPEDFLRPPGWRENNQTLGDEQLAIMLQNEMFQREVARNMGDDFVTRMRGNGTRQDSNLTSSTSRQSDTGREGGTANTVPDMGILKGLSSLSAGAKRNLNALAAKFETKNKTTASSTPVETGIVNYDETSPRSNVRRGLLSKDEDDDEEEEEIVFGNNPRAHRLDDRHL